LTEKRYLATPHRFRSIVASDGGAALYTSAPEGPQYKAYQRFSAYNACRWRHARTTYRTLQRDSFDI